jgi:ATP synthase protein I
VSVIDLPRARRLAFSVVLGQAGVTVIVALCALGLGGPLAARSALLGGGIATAGSVALAALGFATSAGASAQRVVAGFYVGEAAKLAVVIVLFVVVLKVISVVPLAMLTAFAATYLVYWVALVGTLPAAGSTRPGV